MKSKTERAAHIAKAIIQPNLAAAKRSAGGDISGRTKWLQVQTSEWSARIKFQQLSELTELIDDSVAADNDREWNEMELVADGCIRLRVQWCGREVTPLVFIPGRWERRFGLDGDGDSERLLPKPRH